MLGNSQDTEPELTRPEAVTRGVEFRVPSVEILGPEQGPQKSREGGNQVSLPASAGLRIWMWEIPSYIVYGYSVIMLLS